MDGRMDGIDGWDWEMSHQQAAATQRTNVQGREQLEQVGKEQNSLKEKTEKAKERVKLN